MNAIIYGAGIGHDGDLVEKDLSGKGANRTSQFADHEEILRESMVTPYMEEGDDEDGHGLGDEERRNSLQTKQFNSGQGKPTNMSTEFN